MDGNALLRFMGTGICRRNERNGDSMMETVESKKYVGSDPGIRQGIERSYTDISRETPRVSDIERFAHKAATAPSKQHCAPSKDDGTGN